MLQSTPSVLELAEILVDYSEILILLFQSSDRPDPIICERLKLIYQLSTGIVSAASQTEARSFSDRETQTTKLELLRDKSPYSSYSSSVVTTIRVGTSKARYSTYPWSWEAESSDSTISELHTTASKLDNMNFKIRIGSSSHRSSRLTSSDDTSTARSWAEIELEKAKERRKRDIEYEKNEKKERRRRRKLEKKMLAEEIARREREPPVVFSEPVWDGSTAVGSPNSRKSTNNPSGLSVQAPEFSPNISPRTTMPLQRANSEPAVRQSVQARRGIQPLVLPSTINQLDASTSTAHLPDVVSPAKSLMTFWASSNNSSAGKSNNSRMIHLSSARKKLRDAFASIRVGGSRKSSEIPQIYVDSDDTPMDYQANAAPSPNPDAPKSFLGSEALRPLTPMPGRPSAVRKTSSATITPLSRRGEAEAQELESAQSPPFVDPYAPLRFAQPTTLLPQRRDLDTDPEAQRELEGFRDRNRTAFAPNFKRRPSAPRPSFDDYPYPGPPDNSGWNQRPLTGTPWPREYPFFSQYSDVDEGLGAATGNYRGGRLVKSMSVPRHHGRDPGMERWKR